MAKRWIEISDDIASSSFNVSPRAKKAYAELTFLGDTLACLRHDPTSIDGGKVVFHWDTNARSLPSGWYALRLFVDGCLCLEQTLRVANDCWAVYAGDEEYNPCYVCDGLPKSPDQKCCSTILDRKRCTPQVCPPGEDPRPIKYTPQYEV